jgi:hypothetical protein
MSALNTRLKESDKDETIRALNQVLDNLPKFWQMPVRDRNKWIRLYNSKFPQEIFDAMDICQAWGYTPSTYEANGIRFVIDHEAKYYSANIRLDWLPPPPGRPLSRQPLRWTNEIRQNKKICVDVRTPLTNDTARVAPAMWLSVPEMHKYLGVEDTEHFMEWIVSTADMRLELKEAVQTIAQIMEMAKTAGQVKRMVPDLLQYLPPKLQLAYKDQVRASSLPFEWASYNKPRVERLLIALGKGHLLAGMGKEGQKDWTASSIEDWVWGAEVTVSHAREHDIVNDYEQI